MIPNSGFNFSAYFEASDEIALNTLAECLQSVDLQFLCNKPNYIKSKRIIARSILTSKGLLTFKRRYYYNEIEKTYFFYVDSKFKFEKYFKICEDLKYEILIKINMLSYKQIGDTLVKNVPISKSTILRIIVKTDLSTTEKVIETSNKLHIQVDEVYLTVRNNKHKQKLYTLSAFTEKKKENDRNVLKNVNLFATWDKNELIEQINFYTNHVYKIGLEK